MNVTQFAQQMGLSIFCQAEDAEQRTITGCYLCDLLSWVIGHCKNTDGWITIQSNVNVAAVAVMTECSCVILAEGVTMEPDVLQKAQDRGVTVLGSTKTAYEIVCDAYNILRK